MHCPSGDWRRRRRLLLLQLFVPLVLLCCLLPVCSCAGRDEDRAALLRFKAAVSSDPGGLLSLWSETGDPCSWPGVSCNERSRVVALEVSGSGGGGDPADRQLGAASLHTGSEPMLGPRKLGRKTTMRSAARPDTILGKSHVNIITYRTPPVAKLAGRLSPALQPTQRICRLLNPIMSVTDSVADDRPPPT